jgi:hypothetical protein
MGFARRAEETGAERREPRPRVRERREKRCEERVGSFSARCGG